LSDIDASLLSFEALSLFNREVNWLDIDMDEQQPFQLQHIESRIIYDISIQEAGESTTIFITQMWQQLLQFLSGIFG